MKACEKCKSTGISGPHYDRSKDAMRYICLRCGFDWWESFATGGARKRWPGAKP